MNKKWLFYFQYDKLFVEIGQSGTMHKAKEVIKIINDKI
jgi:hypothetical protein